MTFSGSLIASIGSPSSSFLSLCPRQLEILVDTRYRLLAERAYVVSLVLVVGSIVLLGSPWDVCAGLPLIPFDVTFVPCCPRPAALLAFGFRDE